jgi:hypothetical protein
MKAGGWESRRQTRCFARKRDPRKVVITLEFNRHPSRSTSPVAKPSAEATCKPNMPRPFLDVFPREIRDLIYTSVLQSPSGAVSLSPWTVEVARSLSLLRTCKQIRRECKDIIWQHNGLWLRDNTQLSRRWGYLERSKSIKHIQHVKIYLALLDRYELEWIGTAFKNIAGWSRHGNLKTITLCSARERPRSVEEFHEELQLMLLGDSVDGRLYREASTWTRMVIYTGWPPFAHWGKQMWLKAMLQDSSKIHELLAEMHGTLRGELWINGSLCFKDKQAVRTFSFDPRDGELHFVIGETLPLDRVNYYALE